MLMYNYKNAILNALLCFVSGFLMATRFKMYIQVVGNSLIAGIQSLVTNAKASAKQKVINLVIDVSIAVIYAIAGGNGVGAKFWNKGFSAYYVKVFKQVLSLRPTKQVIKAFAKAFGYYISGSVVSACKTIIKECR